MKYDHFHVEYEDAEGNQHEIEGGFSGLPDMYKDFMQEQREKFWRDLAVQWGMPKDAKITGFWLGG